MNTIQEALKDGIPFSVTIDNASAIRLAASFVISAAAIALVFYGIKKLFFK